MKLNDFKQLLESNGIKLENASENDIKSVYTKINKEITAVKNKALSNINKGEIANDFLKEQNIDIENLVQEKEQKESLENEVKTLLNQINDLQAQNEQEKLNTIKTQAVNTLLQSGVKEKFNDYVLDKINTENGYDFEKLETLKESDPELFMENNNQVSATHSVNVPQERTELELVQEFLEKNI